MFRLRMAIWVPMIAAPVLCAQSKYSLVPPDPIQARLNLYKGSDSAREAALKRTFIDVGCADSNLVEQTVPTRKQPNVICVLPGSTAETIVIGAHFDHVSEGSGIVDNWSGAALLPSLFQSLSGSPRTHTFIFVGFADEEDGEIGSRLYARQLSNDEISHLHLMVNLDSLGLGPTEVWVSRSEKQAVSLLAATAHATHLPLAGMNLEGFGESDEESFIRRKVCTVTVHSITPQTRHVLHTSADSPSAIRFQDYYDTYHLLAAYLSILDTQIASTTSTCPEKPL